MTARSEAVAGVTLVDGRVRTARAARVEWSSPLWLAGRTLFETMLVRPATVSPFAIFQMDAHIARLTESAMRLGWQAPRAERLRQWVCEAAALFRERSDRFGRLRLTVAWTRGGRPPLTVVTVNPYEPPPGGAAAVVTPYRVPALGGEAAVKSGSRLHYALAEEWAAARGADEGLLIDHAARPLEGARSNLFMFGDGCLVTPPLSAGVLPGVTRDVVLRIAQSEGVAVRMETWDGDRIRARALSGSVFLTNALWGLRPVAVWDGVACSPPPAPVSRLAARYKEAAQLAAPFPRKRDV